MSERDISEATAPKVVIKRVILAGGRGTRLAPYTTVLPKPLVPVGGIPILETVLRQLRFHGFEEAVLAVGYLSSLIRAYFNEAPHSLSSRTCVFAM